MQSSTEVLTMLRKITIIAFPPGFILNLIHGIVSHKAFPALGLIPLAGSALLGASLLYRNKISYGGSPISLSPANILMIDFALAVLFLIFLIFSWVIVPGHDWSDPSEVMLGTYGTVPLMGNLGIHGYFVGIEVRHMVRHARDCPNPAHHRGRDEYTPLAGSVEAGYEDEEEGRNAV